MVCPGYWRWAAPEMAFAVEDFDPKVVVWQDEEIGDTVAKARAELGSDHRALWLRHDSEGADSYESFLASGSPDDPVAEVDPDAALLVIYTAAISGRRVRLDALAPQPARHGRERRLDGGHRHGDRLPRRRTHVPHRQLPVLGRPGLRARRQERDRPPRGRRGTAPAPCGREVHARLPDAADHRAARRAEPRGLPRPVPPARERRRTAVAGHRPHRREPLHPQRRRHGPRLRADRGDRLRRDRRLRWHRHRQRGPPRPLHRRTRPGRHRYGVRGRRGRRDLRPR